MRKLLNDLLGYFRRNSRKMSEIEIKRSLNEIKQIESELQKQLRMRGVV